MSIQELRGDFDLYNRYWSDNITSRFEGCSIRGRWRYLDVRGFSVLSSTAVEEGFNDALSVAQQANLED